MMAYKSAEGKIRKRDLLTPLSPDYNDRVKLWTVTCSCLLY